MSFRRTISTPRADEGEYGRPTNWIRNSLSNLKADLPQEQPPPIRIIVFEMPLILKSETTGRP